MNSKKFMQIALDQAHIARNKNEVPVGAVITFQDKVIGVGSNSVISDNFCANHAEINAIRSASKFIDNYRLIDCDLYVTLEPCHMCAKAIVHARIRNLFFGVREPKSGAIVSNDNFLDKDFNNHKVKYQEGILKQECRYLIREFFHQKRS